jgi:hypothetical protein
MKTMTKYLQFTLCLLALSETHGFRPMSTVGLKSTTFVHRGQSSLRLSPIEAWDSYNRALESDPLVIKSLTASIILGAADLVGQSITPSGEGKRSTDWARTLRFAIFGFVLQAPWNHFYYKALDTAIPPTFEPFSLTNGIKVAIDQGIQAPIFTVLIFVFLGVLEGKSFESIKYQLDEDYKQTLSSNCKLCCSLNFCELGLERCCRVDNSLTATLFSWCWHRETLDTCNNSKHWFCSARLQSSVPELCVLLLVHLLVPRFE